MHHHHDHPHSHHHHQHRRDFLRRAVVGSLVCTFTDSAAALLPGQDAPANKYDLLIKDGRVIDPAQKLSAIRDVAINGTKITRVAENIPATEARWTSTASPRV